MAPITAEAAGPSLSGAVKTPLALDEPTLTGLPATTVEVKYKTSAGSAADSYTGVLLWDLLKKAELVSGDGKNAALKHTLLITATNGYAVAVALAEFDPDYGNKQVLLAYKGTGDRASFEHLKLIVPGDLRGGRSVRDIATIEVK
jgi:hypothetical protein